VGIERLIKEGQVTLATFYRHFPSKVDLVVAYLRGAHDQMAARAAPKVQLVVALLLVPAAMLLIAAGLLQMRS
jgi:AcrR family transcriptional regulator